MILKNHLLKLIFIYKSELLTFWTIFWLYAIMQSINNKFVFKNGQNLLQQFELPR